MESILSTLSHTPWLIALLVIWSMAWKAIATWHAARNSQLGWFIALFIINTIGLLEIIYLLLFKKKTARGGDRNDCHEAKLQ